MDRSLLYAALDIYGYKLHRLPPRPSFDTTRDVTVSSAELPVYILRENWRKRLKSDFVAITSFRDSAQ